MHPTSTNSSRFRCNTTEKTEKLGTLVFEKMLKNTLKNAFVLKTAFRISLKIYITTYKHLYLLDSEKSKVYFKKNPGHTGAQNFGQKN